MAKKEHDKLFHKRLMLSKGTQQYNELYELFPSRKECIRLKKKERKGKNALEINAIQLERTVLRATNKFRNKPVLEWQKKLYAYLEDLSVDVLKGTFAIPKPKIIPQFKEVKDSKTIFRPIAQYTVKDRIKISQASKYLTECFDPTFEECSYAFRSARILKKSYSHHSAVKDIIEYKTKFKDQDLWVSECDIKKFYDCVNHDVVTTVLNKKIVECKKLGLAIDKRSIDIFHSYLDSYTFNFDVRTINLGRNRLFGWVTEKELLKVGSDSSKDRIGVPQGGAISCLIANLLMDSVDKKVLKMNVDGNLFYARFCDDMVLLHPDNLVCQKALDEYKLGLEEIKLLNHPFTIMTSYDKKFWKSKSKAPYQWGNNLLKKSNVPWLSFVGYQVSYDLILRVRRSSLKKEMEKQVRETGKVISCITQGKDFRVSEKSINKRLKQRLLSMSVGRKNIFDMHRRGNMCWTSGFRLLKEYPNVQYQAKHLDKKRIAQFARLESHLRKMDETQRPPVTKKAVKIVKDPKYYGSPFSYHFQFKN
ncbi:reverse transcriptase domain-containing protein [Olleya sp. Ti.3.14]|uniref:reverse transcriptase domain-containing protein n=1 Tax=Olleya sp. Ti.3.14 TaxID=3121297 RepID=UPI00311F1A80